MEKGNRKLKENRQENKRSGLRAGESDRTSDLLRSDDRSNDRGRRGESGTRGESEGLSERLFVLVYKNLNISKLICVPVDIDSYK